MAINFSASFAACIAAGLKVPRQFMYCITQEPTSGAPYVLYGKDGAEAASWDTPHSPAPSPYDHTQPDQPHLQANGGVDDDTSVDASVLSIQQQAQQTQAAQQNNQQNPVSVPEPAVSESSASGGDLGPGLMRNLLGDAPSGRDTAASLDQDAFHHVATPAPTPPHPPRCFSEQPVSSVGQVYARPSQLISPNSFMSYLKQPTVMITSINHDSSQAPTPELHPGMQELLNGGLKGGLGGGHNGLQLNGSLLNGTGVTKDVRLFKCLTCGKDFKQKSTLLQHERIHTDSRPYGCQECGKRFRQQSHLTQHLRIHANEKPFACVYCERTFRQRAILNQHLRIHSDVSPHLLYKNGQLWPQDVPFPQDTKDIQPFQDPTEFHDQNMQFPAYFKDSKGLAHGVFGAGGGKASDVIQSGRSAGMPLYVRCPICQKEFKQKSTLLQHGCIHIESRPYPCGECGKRFRQQSHLTQHLRIHTNEKPYSCIYCGRNFRQRTILNQHVRIHTGEKPYKCTQCGKDFRQKAILDQHTRTHQGDRPYCCPMPNCRRRFSTESEVKRHIDNHMNPHSSKRTATTRQPHHQQPISLVSNYMVKPEVYFSQCYTPGFQQGYQALGGVAPMLSPQQDFKPQLPPPPASLAPPTAVVQ